MGGGILDMRQECNIRVREMGRQISRHETLDMRPETGDAGKDTRDMECETGDPGHETEDMKQETWDKGQETGDARQNNGCEEGHA